MPHLPSKIARSCTATSVVVSAGLSNGGSSGRTRKSWRPGKLRGHQTVQLAKFVNSTRPNNSVKRTAVPLCGSSAAYLRRQTPMFESTSIVA